MPSSTLPPLVTATAGALGSATSNAIVYPLDLVTSRLQTQGRRGKGRYTTPLQAAQTIVRQDGLGGLYSGLESDTVSTLLSNLTFFGCYQRLHTALSNHKRRGRGDATSKTPSATLHSPFEEIVIGFLAGVLSRVVTNPLSVITVRKQTASKQAKRADTAARTRARATSDAANEDFGSVTSSIELARDIYAEDGVTGFYAGFGEAAILSINPSLTMYGFELFKRLLLPKSHREKPTALEVFLTSAMASSLATSLCYPLIISKTRMQSGRYSYANLIAAMRAIVERQGVQGLFQGWTSQIAKSTLQLGLSMTLKSRVELLFVALFRRAQARRYRADA